MHPLSPAIPDTEREPSSPVYGGVDTAPLIRILFRARGRPDRAGAGWRGGGV